MRSLLVALALVLAASAARADDPFRLLTYNVFLLPTFVKTSGQMQRAEVLPAHLPDCDVIVFNEAFDDDARAVLRAGLRARWPHQTRVIGEDAGIGQDGGVFVASRWPIVRARQRIFDAALSFGNDAKAQKGVAYACIQRPDRRYHVFGIHLQAGEGMKRAGTRAYQLAVIAGLVRELAIPADEPVLLAGDFNVPRADATEHGRMRALLGAAEPAVWMGHPFTSDPQANALNSDDHPSVFDYVLWSKAHLAPASSACTTLALTAREPVRYPIARMPGAPPLETRELSDHYPVLGTFVFGAAAPAPEPAPRAAAPRETGSLLGLPAFHDLRSVR